MSTISISEELEIKRCYTCYRQFAILMMASRCGFYRCPYCSKQNAMETDARVEELQHSNTSLRGVITKLKRRLDDAS
jgi:hypothetical protein